MRTIVISIFVCMLSSLMLHARDTESNEDANGKVVINFAKKVVLDTLNAVDKVVRDSDFNKDCVYITSNNGKFYLVTGHIKNTGTVQTWSVILYRDSENRLNQLSCSIASKTHWILEGNKLTPIIKKMEAGYIRDELECQLNSAKSLVDDMINSNQKRLNELREKEKRSNR